MSIKDKAKEKIKKQAKKMVFKVIKPFLPFIIIIVGIVFAVCTVADSLFTTEEDMQVAEQLSNENYEEQYAQWLQEKETSPTTISNGTGLVPTGMFIWPIPGYTTITSHFGMRTHPITGVYKLHSGTDVGAPIGANFVAMADGTVIKALYNNAYGNMVMIDHGNGIVTLYAHGSEILVTANQIVKQGEPVLKVGSTGYSTGAHAHFEIRINNSYVNPENYFK